MSISTIGRLGLAQGKGVGASVYAPSPAPAGFRWEFVTSSGQVVTFCGQPVVALMGG